MAEMDDMEGLASLRILNAQLQGEWVGSIAHWALGKIERLSTALTERDATIARLMRERDDYKLMFETWERKVNQWLGAAKVSNEKWTRAQLEVRAEAAEAQLAAMREVLTGALELRALFSQAFSGQRHLDGPAQDSADYEAAAIEQNIRAAIDRLDQTKGPCRLCKGKGRITVRQSDPDNPNLDIITNHDCPDCQTKGESHDAA